MSNYLPDGCSDEMCSSAPDFSEIQEDPDNVIDMPNRAECQHEWKEEYYGTRCVKCDLFHPFGCAPWDTEEPWSRDDDYIEMCGEQS